MSYRGPQSIKFTLAVRLCVIDEMYTLSICTEIFVNPTMIVIELNYIGHSTTIFIPYIPSCTHVHSIQIYIICIQKRIYVVKGPEGIKVTRHINSA